MAPKGFYTIFVLFFFIKDFAFQQVYESADQFTCKFSGEDEEKKIKSIQIYKKLWQIADTNRRLRNKMILISPCRERIPSSMGCASNAAVCIVSAKNRADSSSITNAGEFFDYVYDPDKGQMVLQSMNGQPCSATENFTVVVEFSCSPNTNANPRYLYHDECELRLEMMSHDCVPPCTAKYKGHLIDLRSLRALKEITVEEPSIQKTFVLNFCKTSGNLAYEGSANSKIPLASSNSQRVIYEYDTNNLVIKGHFGTNKRFRLKTEIHIKCNWTMPEISNLKYLVPVTQGKTFKFEGQSSLACIKLPMNCFIKDEYKDYLVYNLTSLNKRNDKWKVKNVVSGEMYMNLCGKPLQSFPANSDCTAQYSQACYKTRTGSYINLGSIPINFHVTEDGTVKGTFTDGSICSAGKTYSTEIEFFCSKQETGPVLQSIDECFYKIKWETPAACPKNIASGSKCLISGIVGNINLQNIYTSLDRTHSLSQTSYLRYNLCGPLHQNCNVNENGLGSSSVCYVTTRGEYSVGFASDELTLDHTSLRLNLKGQRCNSQTESSTKIQFHCDYTASVEGTVHVNVVQDGCAFEMNIYTPLACPPPVFTNCKYFLDHTIYDLTPLLKNDSNYMVRDNTDPNIIYILNVCRSVINTKNTLCPSNSGTCMQNATEPNIIHKFISMGTVNPAISAPMKDGQDIIIQYSLGLYCPEAETMKHSTIIQFRCSQYAQEPSLLYKSKCLHKFLWHSPHACPKQALSLETRSTNNSCQKYKHPHTGKLIDFNNIHQKLVLNITEGKELYKFDLCEGTYEHCLSERTDCESISASTEFSVNSAGLYFLYSFNSTCVGKNKANKVHIQMICNPSGSEESFSLMDIDNCTVYMNFKSSSICSTYKEYASTDDIVIKSYLPRRTINAIEKYSSSVMHDEPIISPPNLSNLTLRKTTITSLKCTLKHEKSGFDYDLENFKSQNMTSSIGNNYTVTFNGMSPCEGHVCKNGLSIVSKTNGCPLVQYDNVKAVIKLLYNSTETCNDPGTENYIEVWLICKSSTETATVTEAHCDTIIKYPSKEVCPLLEISSTKNLSSEIAAGSVGFITVVLVTLGVMIKKNKLPKICQRAKYESVPEDKSRTHVYLRDLTA